MEVLDCDVQLKMPLRSLDEDGHVFANVLIKYHVERRQINDGASVDFEENVSVFELTICGSSWQDAMSHNENPSMMRIARILECEESLDVASLHLLPILDLPEYVYRVREGKKVVSESIGRGASLKGDNLFGPVKEGASNGPSRTSSSCFIIVCIEVSEVFVPYFGVGVCAIGRI